MLIISKEKDYYDYLSGVYGVEPNLVYDRRTPDSYSLAYGDALIVCGKVYELYTYEGITYHGEELETIKLVSNSRDYYGYSNIGEIRKKSNLVKVPGERFNRYNDWNWVTKDSYDDPFNLNVELDSPIIILPLNKYTNRNFNNCSLNPNLSKLNLASIIPPEEIYISISTWLGIRIERFKESSIPTTDSQKIVNKGFDLKSSFRPNIKKR